MEQGKRQVTWPEAVQNVAVLATLVAIVWAIAWAIVQVGR